MTEVQKASKRHCWSNRPPSEAFECGFEAGAEWAFYRSKEFINAESLFLAIGCGDEKHQEWLRTELKRWFETKFHLALEGAYESPSGHVKEKP